MFSKWFNKEEEVLLEKYYRYSVRHSFSLHDECDVLLSTNRVDVEFKEYDVLSYTSCGVWISLGFGHKKFVNTKVKNKWACSYIEEARESFLNRKNNEIKVLEAKIARVNKAINIVKSGGISS